MKAFEDGDWWVRGTLLDDKGKSFVAMIEKVDPETEDPAQRMNFWRGLELPDGSKQWSSVHLVEVQVLYKRPVFETGDHRPIFVTAEDGSVSWECHCGQEHGLVTKSVGDMQMAAAGQHDRHVHEVAPKLRCQRCGERTHKIDYCPREA